MKSTPGQGSTFWFEVRLQRTAQSRPLQDSAADLTGRRALVVDDNETNRKILHYQLESWGMVHASAENGPDALARLRTAYHRDEPYDIVLLDLHMPGMDGVQLARAIKADPSLAPSKLVMLASMSPTEHRYELADVDIGVYLTKPVRQSLLYNALVSVVSVQSSEEKLPTKNSGSKGESTDHLPLPRFPSGCNVLVAEDNVVNQTVAVRMLQNRGLSVDVAGNGLEVLESIRRTCYHLIFMDCHMPEMDGYSATAAIRESEAIGTVNRHIPIIAMTANALAGDDEKCFAAGMDDYLPKPVQPDKLDAVLARWLTPADPVPDNSASLEPAKGPPSLPACPIDVNKAGVETDVTNGNGRLRAQDQRRDGAGADGDVTEDIARASPSELDISVIADLRKLQEVDGPNILSMLADMYLGDTLPRMEALADAVRLGEAADVKQIAHSMKGSSSNLGAHHLARLCGQMEALGRDGSLEGAPSLLLDIETTYRRVEVELRAKCSATA